jgi:hypothetical protein
MAKSSRAIGNETESLSSYFNKIFDEQPKLLWERSNQALLDRYLMDHPDETEVPARVKTNLANIKSVRRKKSRKKGRKAKAVEPVVTWLEAEAVPEIDPTIAALEQLEEHIDEGLSLAKQIDREELEEVITLLRRARNAVVWKLGQ